MDCPSFLTTHGRLQVAVLETVDLVVTALPNKSSNHSRLPWNRRGQAEFTHFTVELALEYPPSIAQSEYGNSNSPSIGTDRRQSSRSNLFSPASVLGGNAATHNTSTPWLSVDPGSDSVGDGFDNIRFRTALRQWTNEQQSAVIGEEFLFPTVASVSALVLRIRTYQFTPASAAAASHAAITASAAEEAAALAATVAASENLDSTLIASTAAAAVAAATTAATAAAAVISTGGWSEQYIGEAKIPISRLEAGRTVTQWYQCYSIENGEGLRTAVRLQCTFYPTASHTTPNGLQRRMHSVTSASSGGNARRRLSTLEVPPAPASPEFGPTIHGVGVGCAEGSDSHIRLDDLSNVDESNFTPPPSPATGKYSIPALSLSAPSGASTPIETNSQSKCLEESVSVEEFSIGGRKTSLERITTATAHEADVFSGLVDYFLLLGPTSVGLLPPTHSITPDGALSRLVLSESTYSTIRLHLGDPSLVLTTARNVSESGRGGLEGLSPFPNSVQTTLGKPGNGLESTATSSSGIGIPERGNQMNFLSGAASPINSVPWWRRGELEVSVWDQLPSVDHAEAALPSKVEWFACPEGAVVVTSSSRPESTRRNFVLAAGGDSDPVYGIAVPIYVQVSAPLHLPDAILKEVCPSISSANGKTVDGMLTTMSGGILNIPETPAPFHEESDSEHSSDEDDEEEKDGGLNLNLQLPKLPGQSGLQFIASTGAPSENQKEVFLWAAVTICVLHRQPYTTALGECLDAIIMTTVMPTIEEWEENRRRLLAECVNNSHDGNANEKVTAPSTSTIVPATYYYQQAAELLASCPPCRLRFDRLAAFLVYECPQPIARLLSVRIVLPTGEDGKGNGPPMIAQPASAGEVSFGTATAAYNGAKIINSTPFDDVTEKGSFGCGGPSLYEQMMSNHTLSTKSTRIFSKGIRFSIPRHVTFTAADPTTLPSPAPFSTLLRTLGPRGTVDLLTLTLSEARLCLHSNCHQRLSEVLSAVVAAVYPMRWCHVYVPAVPPQLLSLLEAPVPFLLGTTTSWLWTAAPMVSATPDLVLVDIDTGSISGGGLGPIFGTSGVVTGGFGSCSSLGVGTGGGRFGSIGVVDTGLLGSGTTRTNVGSTSNNSGSSLIRLPPREDRWLVMALTELSVPTTLSLDPHAPNRISRHKSIKPLQDKQMPQPPTAASVAQSLSLDRQIQLIIYDVLFRLLRPLPDCLFSVGRNRPPVFHRSRFLSHPLHQSNPHDRTTANEYRATLVPLTAAAAFNTLTESLHAPLTAFFLAHCRRAAAEDAAMEAMSTGDWSASSVYLKNARHGAAVGGVSLPPLHIMSAVDSYLSATSANSTIPSSMTNGPSSSATNGTVNNGGPGMLIRTNSFKGLSPHTPDALAAAVAASADGGGVGNSSGVVSVASPSLQRAFSFRVKRLVPPTLGVSVSDLSTNFRKSGSLLVGNTDGATFRQNMSDVPSLASLQPAARAIISRSYGSSEYHGVLPNWVLTPVLCADGGGVDGASCHTIRRLVARRLECYAPFLPEASIAAAEYANALSEYAMTTGVLSSPKENDQVMLSDSIDDSSTTIKEPIDATVAAAAASAGGGLMKDPFILTLEVPFGSTPLTGDDDEREVDVKVSMGAPPFALMRFDNLAASASFGACRQWTVAAAASVLGTTSSSLLAAFAACPHATYVTSSGKMGGGGVLQTSDTTVVNGRVSATAAVASKLYGSAKRCQQVSAAMVDGSNRIATGPDAVIDSSLTEFLQDAVTADAYDEDAVNSGVKAAAEALYSKAANRQGLVDILRHAATGDPLREGNDKTLINDKDLDNRQFQHGDERLYPLSDAAFKALGRLMSELLSACNSTGDYLCAFESLEAAGHFCRLIRRRRRRVHCSQDCESDSEEELLIESLSDDESGLENASDGDDIEETVEFLSERACHHPIFQSAAFWQRLLAHRLPIPPSTTPTGSRRAYLSSLAVEVRALLCLMIGLGVNSARALVFLQAVASEYRLSAAEYYSLARLAARLWMSAGFSMEHPPLSPSNNNGGGNIGGYDGEMVSQGSKRRPQRRSLLIGETGGEAGLADNLAATSALFSALSQESILSHGSSSGGVGGTGSDDEWILDGMTAMHSGTVFDYETSSNTSPRISRGHSYVRTPSGQFVSTIAANTIERSVESVCPPESPIVTNSPTSTNDGGVSNRRDSWIDPSLDDILGLSPNSSSPSSIIAPTAVNLALLATRHRSGSEYAIDGSMMPISAQIPPASGSRPISSLPSGRRKHTESDDDIPISCHKRVSIKGLDYNVGGAQAVAFTRSFHCVSHWLVTGGSDGSFTVSDLRSLSVYARLRHASDTSSPPKSNSSTTTPRESKFFGRTSSTVDTPKCNVGGVTTLGSIAVPCGERSEYAVFSACTNGTIKAWALPNLTESILSLVTPSGDRKDSDRCGVLSTSSTVPALSSSTSSSGRLSEYFASGRRRLTKVPNVTLQEPTGIPITALATEVFHTGTALGWLLSAGDRYGNISLTRHRPGLLSSEPAVEKSHLGEDGVLDQETIISDGIGRYVTLRGLGGSLRTTSSSITHTHAMGGANSGYSAISALSFVPATLDGSGGRTAGMVSGAATSGNVSNGPSVGTNSLRGVLEPWLAVGTESGVVGVIDFTTSSPIFVAEGHGSAVNRVLAVKRAQFLSAAADRRVKLWDVRAPPRPVATSTTVGSTSSGSLPSGLWEARSLGGGSSAAKNSVNSWRHCAGSPITEVTVGGWDNMLVITATAGGGVMIWDLRYDLSRPVTAINTGHRDRISCLIWGSPSFTTASYDGTVRSWDSINGRCTARLAVFPSPPRPFCTQPTGVSPQSVGPAIVAGVGSVIRASLGGLVNMNSASSTVPVSEGIVRMAMTDLTFAPPSSGISPPCANVSSAAAAAAFNDDDSGAFTSRSTIIAQGWFGSMHVFVRDRSL